MNETPDPNDPCAEAVAALASPGAPVMVFCASHSGSRLLASILQGLGVFMGARVNESGDSLDVFDLVRWLVDAHAPDFSSLLARGDPELARRAGAAFAAHLAGRGPGQPWGWKLPETANVLPVMTRLFPQARLIHLVRDGRDVAFSPFLAPKDLFWRKIYFGDANISAWRGLAMTQRAYRAKGHLFNAARWVRSVTLGRGGGRAAEGRYLEMRYEALAAAPGAEIERLGAFLELSVPPGLAAFSQAHGRSIGKWRSQSARRLAELRPVLQPTLGEFGYQWEDVGAKVSAGTGAEPGGLGGLFRVRDRR